MSEQQGDYITETKEALEMLGKGYDEPSVVIERPRVVAERQPGGEFVERTTPVYVKFSTAFKEELKKITGSELKVWTYLILSINEEGVAFPGIRTIAEAIDMSHQTVITAVEGLEKKSLLHVVRGERRYNIYQPSEEYVAVFDKSPMSQKIRPVKKEERKSQVLTPDESNGLDLNKTLNQNKQEDIDSQIFTALSNLTGGMLNTETPRFVDIWKEKHTLEWILGAIGIAESKNVRGAGAVKYVNSVLIGWEANGYPKSREEQVQERRKTPSGLSVADKWLLKKQQEAANG